MSKVSILELKDLEEFIEKSNSIGGNKLANFNAIEILDNKLLLFPSKKIPEKFFVRIEGKLEFLSGLEIYKKFNKNFSGNISKDNEEKLISFLSHLSPDFCRLKLIHDRNFNINRVSFENPEKWDGLIEGSNEEPDEQIKENKNLYKIWNVDVSPEQKFRIINGDPQVKKSWLIISSAMYFAMMKRMSCLIVTQNSIESIRQMFDRCESVFKTFRELMGLPKLDFERIFKLTSVIRGKQCLQEEMNRAMTGENPKIMVCIRNAKDMIPINNMLQKSPIIRLVTFIDECDAVDTEYNDCKVQVELDKLKQFSTLIYGITATPLFNMTTQVIDSGLVFRMSLPEHYKDLCNVTFKDLPESALYCSSINDDPLNKDPNMAKYISDFAKTMPYIVSITKEYHPKISLVRIGRTIEPQIKLAEHIYENYGDKITVITYNGGEQGITLRNKKLPTTSIRLSNGKSSSYKKGIHHFRDCHVGSVIEYLESKGATTFPRIMILAGVLADRGITFCSSRYSERLDEGKTPWHLTEMYFISPKSTSISNLIQITSRICGIYKDDIPLVLYSNVCSEIRQSYHLQKELIERAKLAGAGLSASLYDSKTEIPKPTGNLMSDIISKIKISRDKIPSKRKVIKGRLHRVTSDRGMGGWDWEAENRFHTEDIAEFGNGKRPRTIMEIPSQEKLQEIREKYNNINKFDKHKKVYNKGDEDNKDDDNHVCVCNQMIRGKGLDLFEHITSSIEEFNGRGIWWSASRFYRPDMNDQQMCWNWFERFSQLEDEVPNNPGNILMKKFNINGKIEVHVKLRN